jgi:hypothetical protein
MLSNAIRGHMAELGIISAKGCTAELAQLVPNTETTLVSGTTNTTNDLAALLDKIGPAIMIVGSAILGWRGRRLG